MITRRALLLSSLAAPLLAARKPNIVVILADDLGFHDLGMQGNQVIQTPHIDSLARSGVNCTNGYASHPFCSPTRAGLLTGRYQQRFGHENNMVVRMDDPATGLPVSEITLADVLGKAGYATGLVGKWHLGAHPRFHPRERGFQEMYGFVGGGHDYFDPGKPGQEDQHFYPIERIDGTPVLEKEYLTTALGREAGAFVSRHKDHPFFLYLAFNAPHTPLQAPESYIEKYKSSIPDPKRRIYAAMVTAMDDAIGQVLTQIKKLNLERDTLIFFLNDNGGPLGNHSSNEPLRGTKRTLYEGGIRVPYVIRWTGKLPKRSYEQPVNSIDIFPTAVAAAGAALPQDRVYDGVNLLPYLTGKKSGAPHERMFWRTFGGVEYAVREGKYKLVRHGDNPAELYNLDQDVGEQRNIESQNPQLVQRLTKAYQEWSKEMQEPAWLDHIFHREQLSH